jgi:hypothetical protein
VRVGGNGEEAQTMYVHVSKYKNDKIKEMEKKEFSYPFSKYMKIKYNDK